MNECELHQMVGCATCAGTDDLAQGSHGKGYQVHHWTEEERRLAKNTTLTNNEVSALTGRPAKDVAAYRVAALHMPTSRVTPTYPYGRGNQGAGTGPDGERLI